jgi:hypothetical protein
MLPFTKVTDHLERRRRVEADLVWREATRREAEEYLAAVRRILAQAHARQL